MTCALFGRWDLLAALADIFRYLFAVFQHSVSASKAHGLIETVLGIKGHQKLAL